ncbi:MAG: DUF2889 domain-containing protein [Betaproteobacteria bacterium]
MGLSAAAPRRHLHTRRIHCEGFQRDDGLWDIEARIIDTKTHATVEPFRGAREAGAHVHDMQLRLTLDREMVVKDIEVATNEAPYDPCFTVAAAYKGLIGAKIGGGWRRSVNEAVGGTKGCTHLKELLMPAATVAYQTMGSWPKEHDAKDGEARPVALPGKPSARPYFIDGCKAWASDSEVVAKLYPMHHVKKG